MIKEYFVERHNDVLEKSDYPESFKEMCCVYEGTVMSEADGEVVVSYVSRDGSEKKRKVKKDYFDELKIGDKVRIHWQYAVELC